MVSVSTLFYWIAVLLSTFDRISFHCHTALRWHNTMIPTHNVIFRLKSNRPFDKKSLHRLQCLVCVYRKIFAKLLLTSAVLLRQCIPLKPPWLLYCAQVNLDMLPFSKHVTSPCVLPSRCAEIHERDGSYYELYTGWSKNGNKSYLCSSVRDKAIVYMAGW